MTSDRQPIHGQPSTSRHCRTLGVIALVGAGLILAGCGRNGAPEYDNGQPVVKSSTNADIPGLPQRDAAPKKVVPPKGNFVLDPLM